MTKQERGQNHEQFTWAATVSGAWPAWANEFSALKPPRVYFLPSGKCLTFHWDL